MVLQEQGEHLLALFCFITNIADVNIEGGC